MTLSSYLPKPIKNVLRPLKKNIQNTFKTEWVSIWVGTGVEKTNSEPLTIAYSGAERHKHYFFKMAFQEGYQEFEINRVRPAEIERAVSIRYGNVDAFFVEAGEEAGFRKITRSLKNYHFQIPIWVRLELEIARNWEDLKKEKGFINFKRIHKKNDYEYAVTQDPAAFKDFYYRIYVPFTKLNHGDAAFFFSYEDAKAKFEQGELLLVKEKGEIFAGVILEFTLTRCTPICIGISEEHADKAQQGLLTAILFEAILRARARQFDKVDLGYSRSHLKDGALRFKSRVTAAVTPDYHKASGYITAKIFNWSEGLKFLFKTNPFIHKEENGQLTGVFFLEDMTETSPEFFEELTRDSFCRGLESLEIRIFREAVEKEIPGISELGLKKIKILSAPDYTSSSTELLKEAA